jgi:hypothetical protein
MKNETHKKDDLRKAYLPWLIYNIKISFPIQDTEDPTI